MNRTETTIARRALQRPSGVWCLLVATVCCLVLACERSASRPASQQGSAGATSSSANGSRPNVLIWLVDTLRRDHLSIYGYDRKTSPRLDQFAEEGVVFEDARAPSSWTKPSTASLLTGVYPKRHGAVGYYGRLESTPLIGTFLEPLGYQTAAFSANPWVHPRWGFAEGFAKFNPTRANLYNNRSSAVANAVIAHLKKPRKGPFFCYVHVLDPHDAYAPPPPFDTMWGKRLARPTVMGRHLRNPPTAIIDDMLIGYDGEITFADQHFGRVLDALRELGLYDDTLIVFTSDHGEEFFEHGRGGHGRTLYDELLRIPLVVKFPGGLGRGQRVDARTSLLDVLPTVLACASSAELPNKLNGMNLLRLLDGATVPDADEAPLFLQADHTIGAAQVPERSILDGVLLGPYKYIERRKPTEETLLFNVASDPGETENLLESEPEVAEELASRLHNYRADSEPGFHLRIVNQQGKTTNAFEYRARLTTSGRFVGLKTRFFEARDEATVSKDGATLVVRVMGVNKRATGASGGLRRHNWWTVDEDRVFFDLKPPDSQVTIERFECLDAAETSAYTGADKTPIDTFPFEFDRDTPRLWARDVDGLVPTGEDMSLGGPAGAFLAVVPDLSRVSRSSLDEDTIESLRSLGYIGDQDE